VTAVIWVGGGFMIQAFAFRILRTGDARRQAEFAKDTEVVGTRVFIPATWVLLLAAIGMMVNLHLSWGQNWIVFRVDRFRAFLRRRRRLSRAGGRADRRGDRARGTRVAGGSGAHPPDPADLALLSSSC
jgi:hypothetical protein